MNTKNAGTYPQAWRIPQCLTIMQCLLCEIPNNSKTFVASLYGRKCRNLSVTTRTARFAGNTTGLGRLKYWVCNMSTAAGKILGQRVHLLWQMVLVHYTCTPNTLHGAVRICSRPPCTSGLPRRPAGAVAAPLGIGSVLPIAIHKALHAYISRAILASATVTVPGAKC